MAITDRDFETDPSLGNTPEVQLSEREQFIKDFVDDTPSFTPEGSLEAHQYEHLTYCGEASFDDSFHCRILAVIRESSEVEQQGRVRRIVAAATYLALDPAAYFVATNDGINTTTWFVSRAEWKINPAYWKANPELKALLRTGKAVSEELILELESADEEDSMERVAASIVLSRQGGTFRLEDEQVSGWLIGDGEFTKGPQFLTDPMK